MMTVTSAWLVFMVYQLDRYSPDRVKARAESGLHSEIFTELEGRNCQEMAKCFHEVASQVVISHAYQVVDTGADRKGGLWLTARQRLGEKPLFLYHLGPPASRQIEQAAEGDGDDGHSIELTTGPFV
jgi:hypothetical protein